MFPSPFRFPRAWLPLELFFCFLLTVDLSSYCTVSHRCSLYQHSSCCPVSESPRNLLVSFHLGKYHSDEQITFPQSPKSPCMWPFLCHFLFKNLSSFWCFYHRDKNVEASIHCEKRQLIALELSAKCQALRGPGLMDALQCLAQCRKMPLQSGLWTQRSVCESWDQAPLRRKWG